MPMQSVFLGTKVCLELLSFLVHHHKREDLGTFIAGSHFDRCLESLFRVYGTLPTPWQFGPPQDWVCTCYLGGPSRPYILPPSTLSWWHVRTFHVGLPTSVESPAPTRDIRPGRTQHPSYAQTL